MTDDLKATSAPPRVRYIANGALDTYTFNFRIFEPKDVVVYLDDILVESGYTVEKEEQNDGGKVIFKTPPENGVKITLMRHLVFERLSDFQEGGALRAKTLNKELDYHTACLQQLDDRIDRTIIFPPYAVSEGINLQLPTPAAGKALVWNEEETSLKNSLNAIDTQYETCKGLVEEAAALKDTVAAQKEEIGNYCGRIETLAADIALDRIARTDMSNLLKEGQSGFLKAGNLEKDTGFDTIITPGFFALSVSGETDVNQPKTDMSDKTWFIDNRCPAEELEETNILQTAYLFQTETDAPKKWARRCVGGVWENWIPQGVNTAALMPDYGNVMGTLTSFGTAVIFTEDVYVMGHWQNTQSSEIIMPEISPNGEDWSALPYGSYQGNITNRYPVFFPLPKNTYLRITKSATATIINLNFYKIRGNVQ